jgi:hypothetical protein
MNKNIKLPSNRSFGLVFFFIFSIISLFPLLSGNNARIWLLTISLIFLVLGLINSKILLPLNKIWFRFGIYLGNFISPIVMGIIFFIIITPISLLLKILGKDVLNLKKNKKKTYWIDRDSTKSEMKNQF